MSHLEQAVDTALAYHRYVTAHGPRMSAEDHLRAASYATATAGFYHRLVADADEPAAVAMWRRAAIKAHDTAARHELWADLFVTLPHTRTEDQGDHRDHRS